MRAARVTVVAALVIGSLAPRAAAQRSAEAFVDAPEHDDTLRVTVEMDPALAVGVGYVRAVPLEIDRFARRVAIHADLRMVIDGASWDLGGGASMMLAEGFGPNVLATVDLEVKLAQSAVHTALVYGYGAALRPGWFDPAWYLAAEASLRGTIAATVFHRDAYRNEFSDVADGTYVTGQLALYFGAVIGVRIERVAILGLRFAWRVPRTFETYAPWFQPYTVSLELGWRL
jgi:hypothetical protein